MALYVKKPVVVEAEWFDRSTFDIVAEFCPTAQGMHFDSTTGQYYIIIPTLEGDHRANEGDYIIKGVNGEFYPCKPDIFWKTYDEVKAGDGK